MMEAVVDACVGMFTTRCGHHGCVGFGPKQSSAIPIPVPRKPHLAEQKAERDSVPKYGTEFGTAPLQHNTHECVSFSRKTDVMTPLGEIPRHWSQCRRAARKAGPHFVCALHGFPNPTTPTLQHAVCPVSRHVQRPQSDTKLRARVA